MLIRDIDPSLASRPKLKSGVSIRTHSLADRHLEDLNAGDLAFCLRQGIAVSAVADRAFESLASDPLLEAELYPGDLLAAVIHADGKGWLSGAQRLVLRDICSIAITSGNADEDEVLSLARAMTAP